MTHTIETMKREDWPAVSRIYLEGIKTGNATFQTQAPIWEEWDSGHCERCRLVMRVDGQVVGWAALSPISKRQVYAGVAENSVYMDLDYKGHGFGSKLLNALIDLSEVSGYWTLQAGIFPENVSSLSLHKKCGFKEVGVRERIGKMENGTWRNVVFLERRSTVVGIE